MINLVRYDAACRAVAEARSVDEVKDILDVSAAMKAYARQAKNEQLEADAWEIRQRARRKLGELMQAQKETVGFNRGGGDQKSDHRVTEKPSDLPKLAEQGIDKNLAHAARTAAAIPAEKFEEHIQQGRNQITSRSAVDVTPAAPVRGTQGTGENEWYTPAEYVERAREVLAWIDLDPASSASAQQTIRADKYFSADDDGLARDWMGRVWLNPPYAQPLIAQFVHKLVEEVARARVVAAVMLTHNYTDTAWFQEAAAHYAPGIG
jgi:hypothetical protein